MDRYIVSERAMEGIQREVRRSPATETGGILVGFHRHQETLVTHASGPGPGAEKGRIHFVKDTPYLQVVLNHLFSYFGANYLGVWHKHPLQVPEPSPGDLSAARVELGDKAVGLKQMLLVICLLKESEVLASPFVVDTRECRKVAWNVEPHAGLTFLGGKQWHQTTLGRSRLAKELGLLKDQGVEVELRKGRDNGYSFWLPLGSGRHLVCVCPNDYPVSPPEALVAGEDGHHPLASNLLQDWTLDCYLADLHREAGQGTSADAR